MRTLVHLLTVTLVLAASGPTAHAANACRMACMKTKKTCLGQAVSSFKTSRTACVGQPDAKTRKSCIKAAKAARMLAKKTCNTTAAACAKACAGGGGGGGGSCTGSKYGDWLASVNGFRALAGLPAVTENPAWSDSELHHSTYMIKTQTITHVETAGPFYTADGAEAGMNGNVAVHSDIGKGDGWAIDTWMTGPFHALGILDPLLAQSAFGIYHEALGPGKFQTGATLDVLRGRTGSPSAANPVVFPGNAASMPLTTFEGNESPNPLANCAGFSQPTGAPIILQYSATPSITAHSVMRDGVAVDHCIFDESTATDASAATNLAARHAVVIMPREVLKNGSKYDVSVTSGGTATSWSFTVACP